MKMIYCTGNIEILEDLRKNLTDLKIQSYQIHDRVLANSEKSDPRLDNQVWPGHNFSIFIQVADADKIKKIKKMIKNMNTDSRGEKDLISCYLWKIDNLIVD